MNKREVLILGQILENLDINATNIKWQYAVVKNKKLIGAEVPMIQSLNKPVEGMEVFESARMGLCNSLCEKTEDGKPVIENNRFKINDMDAFNAGMATLNETHKEVLEKATEQSTEFEKLLDEPCELALHTVKVEFVPNTLKPFELEFLIDKMIVE